MNITVKNYVVRYISKDPILVSSVTPRHEQEQNFTEAQYEAAYQFFVDLVNAGYEGVSFVMIVTKETEIASGRGRVL